MFSIISFIAGLVGVILLLLVPAGVTILPSSAIGIISILAIILGIVGMRKEQKRIATVGIILGVVGIGIFFTFKVLKVAREKAMTKPVPILR